MPGPQRLRHRLFLLLLAFATIPGVTLGLLANRTLNASLELWRSPSVSRALEGSLGVARELLSERRPTLESAVEALLSATPPAALSRGRVSPEALEASPF